MRKEPSFVSLDNNTVCTAVLYLDYCAQLRNYKKEEGERKKEKKLKINVMSILNKIFTDKLHNQSSINRTNVIPIFVV